MCIRIECPVCGKPTWRGCGKHIEDVLSDVPQDDRCSGHDQEPAAQKSGVDGKKELKSQRTDHERTPVNAGAIATAVQGQSLSPAFILEGHTERAWHISWQEDQNLLATASSDKTVRLYSTTDHRYLATIDGNHTRSIRSCAWRPGSSKPVLATASFDSTAGLWDSQTDEITGETEWECAGLLEGHENEVKDVAWSASGTILATCSRDKSIWIWECDNYEDPECLSVMQEHSQDVKCITWHPHEELLASGSYDDDIRLWRDDGDDWICCGKLQGHEGTVWALSFEDNAEGMSPRLASASGDSTIRIWIREMDPANDPKNKSGIPSIIRPNLDQVWKQETILPPQHTGDIYSVCWSKHSHRIASTGEDGDIQIYSQNLGEIQWSISFSIPNAHGVYEINHLSWGATNEEHEVLYSAGDEGLVKVWYIPLAS